MNCLKVSLRAKQGANASQKSLLNIGYSRTVEKLDSSIIFQPFSLSSEMQTILFGSGGTFNNYVDKMRWVGGPKISVFVHVQGKKCPGGGR